MRKLIFIGFIDLINSAPNRETHATNNNNVCSTPNHSTYPDCHNNNQIPYKSARVSYNNTLCQCSNFNYKRNKVTNLDYPYTLFTSAASQYLISSNSNQPSLSLSCKLGTLDKMNEYCSMLENWKWKCNHAELSDNIVLNNNTAK